MREICVRKRKIECSRQICAGQTDGHMEIVTPCDPDGAKN